MSLFLSILAYFTLAIGIWCLLCTVLNLLYFRRHAKKAMKLSPSPDTKVSVIIPARDEEENLPRLLDSLLNQEWKNYEILVIDDQSTDSTWDIIQSYMKKSSIIKGFQSDKNVKLSPYGKINALLQLIPHSSGDVLLCTDADTIHNPTSISKGLMLMEEGNLDILSGFPFQKTKGFMTGTITASMAFSNVIIPHFIINRFQIILVTIGIGQYVMMKKKSYEEVGGYGAMPQKVCDDIGIIQHFMRNGKKYGFRNLHKELSCTMYSDGKSAFKGLERSITDLFPANIFSFIPLLIVVAALLLLFWQPLLIPLFLHHSTPIVLSFSLIGWFLLCISWYFAAKETGFWKSVSLFGFLSVLNICLMYLHGMYRRLTKKGFDWKGRTV